MGKILYLGLDPSRFIKEREEEVIHLPLIRIQPRPFTEVEPFFHQLPCHTHILFTSQTPIPIYVEYAQKAGFTRVDLKKYEYICLGEATAAKLEEFNVEASLVAKIATGEGVIELFQTIPPPKRLFFPHSSLARHVIINYLRGENISFTNFFLYDTLQAEVDLPDLSQFEEIIFTSPSTVRAFWELFAFLPRPEISRAIGPITQRTIDLLRK